MDQRGRRRLAVGAGDADDLVRRKLGPGAGEQLDVADDLDAGLAGALRDRVAVERQAGGDDQAVELAEVRFVEIGDLKLVRPERSRGALSAFVPAPLAFARDDGDFTSFFLGIPRVTLAPLASSASAVASPDRARP